MSEKLTAKEYAEKLHSFKGWESQAIFLIIENSTSKDEFNELLLQE